MGVFYSASRFVVGGVLGLLTRWEIRGAERAPRTGGLIVASNHISFWDPPLIGCAFPREIHFLAKEELFRTPPGLGFVIRKLNAIPIRRGVADLSGLSRALDVLKQNQVLLMFPEGSRMRDAELHPARPGVGMMAVQANVPILPCYISGSNRPRRWLTGSRVRIWFGPLRVWQDLVTPESDLAPGRVLYQQVGDAVMREIAILKTGQETAASRGAA